MSDPTFEALWKNVLDRWDEDRSHGAFLSYCQDSDQLAEAAARYKGMTADRDRAGSAKRRLDGIALMAIAKLESTRSRSPEARRYAFRFLMIAVFAAAIAALAINLMNT